MGAPLLATKNYIPIPQSRWIDRQRLVSRLKAGLDNNHRLTLISASAGAGKSSLLAEWAAAEAGAVVWVSLDAEDNDPIRFWTYCLAAIQTRFADPVDGLLASLRSPQPPAILPFINEIVNKLAGLPVEKLILILDDYHVIDSQPVHDSLGYFLDHLPPNIHLVIATRSDPPLPLHRWRGRGQLTEIRFDDLRFTFAETQLYLTERMQLALSTEDIRQLEKRTEGWIVGLHLAALLMQGRENHGDFIARFSSNNHYILEYLTNEVLDLLPETEQEFLLQISILPQFNPSLCDAVSGRSDSQVFLDRFWKSNLFLIPLDDDHCWYRYHHLFADLLGHKLKQKGEPTLLALYQRAADWYAANQMIDDALRSALAAKNYPMAAELVLKNRRQAMNAGDFKRFFLWMEQFPPGLIASDARLSLVYAVMLYNNGQITPVEEHLNNAQQAYTRLAQAGEIPPTDHDYATLPGQIASFQAMLALRRWDLAGAIHHAEETLRLSAPEDLHSRGMAGIALGRAQSELGLWEQAILTYYQNIPVCESSGNSIGATVCYRQLAELLQIQGRLKNAWAILETALERAARLGQQEFPATGVLRIGLAEIEYEKNQLAQSEDRLDKGLLLVRQGGYLDIQKTAAILKAKLFIAAGNGPEAVRQLRSALDVIHRASMELALTELTANLAQIHAVLGNIDEAGAWADDQDPALSGDPGLTRGIELFCLARIWIRLERWDEARSLLAHLESCAEESKSMRRLAEARLLLAQIAFQQNRPAESFELLEKSLQLGIQQGYQRLYLDEGLPLCDLIIQYQQTAQPNKAVDRWLSNLLPQFTKNNEIEEIPGPFASLPPSQPIPASANKLPEKDTRPAPAPLIEPLSGRELEVLALMSTGLTNPQIAKSLYLSMGTIKTHLNNIYGKLNVRNRAEAVLRAKDLGLL